MPSPACGWYSSGCDNMHNAQKTLSQSQQEHFFRQLFHAWREARLHATSSRVRPLRRATRGSAEVQADPVSAYSWPLLPCNSLGTSQRRQSRAMRCQCCYSRAVSKEAGPCSRR